MPAIPASLGKKVSTRDTDWATLVRRAWGAEFSMPDHGIYEFSNGQKRDSTDKRSTGIYNPNLGPASRTPP